MQLWFEHLPFKIGKFFSGALKAWKQHERTLLTGLVYQRIFPSSNNSELTFSFITTEQSLKQSWNNILGSSLQVIHAYAPTALGQ